MSDYYTPETLAKAAHVSAKTVRRHISLGYLSATLTQAGRVREYRISASEAKRFVDLALRRGINGKRYWLVFPDQDEQTEFGSMILWSQLSVRSDPNNPKHTLRYVPVICRCGLRRDLLASDIRNYKYGGLCQPCSASLYAPRGANHSDWKGGIWINDDGYRFLHISSLMGRDLELAQAMITKSRPYVAEHRLVMARRLNRPLRRDEHVHHRDSQKLNNADDNLELVTPSHHAAVELVMARAEIKRLRALVALLLATGALGKGG